jgi:hypothetical protein
MLNHDAAHTSFSLPQIMQTDTDVQNSKIVPVQLSSSNNASSTSSLGNVMSKQCKSEAASRYILPPLAMMPTKWSGSHNDDDINTLNLGWQRGHRKQESHWKVLSPSVHSGLPLHRNAGNIGISVAGDMANLRKNGDSISKETVRYKVDEITHTLQRAIFETNDLAMKGFDGYTQEVGKALNGLQRSMARVRDRINQA